MPLRREENLTRPPARERVYTCIRPDTYRYFFAPEEVASVWRKLEKNYGPTRELKAFRTREISHRLFLFRAGALGNPVTVIRKRRCSPDDVSAFHRLIGFENVPPGEGEEQ